MLFYRLPELRIEANAFPAAVFAFFFITPATGLPPTDPLALAFLITVVDL